MNFVNMKILKSEYDLNLLINKTNKSQNDLGWEMGLNDVVNETLFDIINPIVNYETRRLTHKQYVNFISGFTINQTDIFYDFYFVDYDGTYTQDYTPIGLTLQENSQMLKEINRSFFKLEFYKTKNNEEPNRNNRLLVYTKNFPIPLGEKFFYEGINDHIYKPTFTGNTVRNKENMYLYWFEDEKNVISEEYWGDTLWVTAKFLNSDNGEIYDFTTIETNQPTESDLYYKIKMMGNQYQVSKNDEVFGLNNKPIKFYQKK